MTGICKWELSKVIIGFKIRNLSKLSYTSCCLYVFCNLPRINIVRCTANTKFVTLRKRMLVFLVWMSRCVVPVGDFRIFFLFVCMCAGVCESGHMYTQTGSHRVTSESRSLLCHVGPGDQTQVVKLDGQGLYPLSCSAGSLLVLRQGISVASRAHWVGWASWQWSPISSSLAL